MSERYFPGEKVRITIDAEVSDHSGDELEYTYPTALGAVEAVAVLDCSPVKVERVAPAEWPPRHKDVWRDGDDNLWIARVLPTNDGGTDIELHGIEDAHSAQVMLAQYGPLTLVHREDEQGEASPSPGEQIPGRPAYVVGQCGHPVARDDWRAGYRVCRNCPYPKQDEQDGGPR